MKLATYRDGARDGQLIVVSRDLATAHYANGIASRLQAVLDDWNYLSPQLEDLYATLNSGKARHAFPFDPAMCMAPLPRAHQCVIGGAYDAPGAQTTTPVHRAASDSFLGPVDGLQIADEQWQADVEGGLAVITGDVPCGASPEQALDAVRLVMLAADWALHGGEPGADALQSRPATAFSAVAVTPDEFGDAWRAGRLALTLQVTLNGRRIGLCDAAEAMRVPYGELIARLARTRGVRAGSIVATGPVAAADPSRGAASIAARRAADAGDDAAKPSPWLVFGDVVRLDMKGRDGLSLFGPVTQTLRSPAADPMADEGGDAGDPVDDADAGAEPGLSTTDDAVLPAAPADERTS